MIGSPIGSGPAAPYRERPACRRTVRLLAGLVVGLACGAGSALAHSGHPHADAGGTPGLVGPVLLGGGLLVVGGLAYLNRTGDIDGRIARVGILLGILVLLFGATVTLT